MHSSEVGPDFVQAQFKSTVIIISKECRILRLKMPEENKSSSLSSAKSFRINAGKSAKSPIGESQGRDAPTSQRSQTVTSSNTESSTNQSGNTLVRTETSNDSGTRDLWRAAFESLSDGEKSVLDPSTNQKPNKKPSHLVDEVIDLTREKCAQYEAGGWHIKREGREDINVREKAKSLICSALVVKDLIDAGLQFDASGYGALAWSVVSFGLQVCEQRPSFLIQSSNKQHSSSSRMTGTDSALFLTPRIF